MPQPRPVTLIFEFLPNRFNTLRINPAGTPIPYVIGEFGESFPDIEIGAAGD